VSFAFSDHIQHLAKVILQFRTYQYLSFFETCGHFFPIPEPILSILAELGLSLTQMCPNFLRHLLALLVKAHEEGLLFGLDEVCHLVLMKRNNQNPGTFLMSPLPGRHIIQGIPYRDQNWREEFFVFKIDEAYVGSFDFSRLPRYWAEDIGEFLFCIFAFPIFARAGIS